MSKETINVKAIFRRYNDGEVIALFPELAATANNPWHCSSYAQVGQHGAADPLVVVTNTSPATPKECAPLLKELQAIGYRVCIIKRCTRAHLQARRKQLEEIAHNV
jgi:hypothetical protein